MPRSRKHVQVWLHNSYFGHVGMMKANARSIESAKTTTPEAKKTAKEIRRLTHILGDQLKTRIDPKEPNNA